MSLARRGRGTGWGGTAPQHLGSAHLRWLWWKFCCKAWHEGACGLRCGALTHPRINRCSARAVLRCPELGRAGSAAVLRVDFVW